MFSVAGEIAVFGRRKQCWINLPRHFHRHQLTFDAFHRACAHCPPHRAVIEWCVDHYSRGHRILVVAGRDAWSRDLTEHGLSRHLPVPIAGLHMRGYEDFRSNTTIKRDIHSQLTVTYDVRAAIDDDPEFVGLWRDVGIPVAMVLDGGGVLELK